MVPCATGVALCRLADALDAADAMSVAEANANAASVTPISSLDFMSHPPFGLLRHRVAQFGHSDAII
jgi:hypothetical protein